MKPVMMTRIAGLLVCTSLTTGCVGAVMMSGAGALPTAMLAVSAMEGVGLLDGLDGAFPGTDVATNPALRQNPDLSGRGLSAQQSDLNARLQALAGNVDGRLATVDSVDCALTEQGRWLLTRASSRADYETAMSTLPEAMRPRVTNVDASVLQGTCIDGLPRGDFVSVGRFETVQSIVDNRISSTDRQRLEGTITAAGEFDGTLRRESHTRSTGSTTGFLTESLTVADLQFANGEGRDILSISRVLDADGAISQIVTVLIEPASQGLQRQVSWAGSMLSSEVTLRDGQMHGWMTNYPVEYVPGYDAGAVSRTCYQSGSVAPEGACGGMPGA